jgi:hypothetical protein
VTLRPSDRKDFCPGSADVSSAVFSVSLNTLQWLFDQLYLNTVKPSAATKMPKAKRRPLVMRMRDSLAVAQ